MAAPSIFTSEDVNGPGPDTNSYGMLRILKACLVDGYAGSPSLGWTLIHDGIGIDSYAGLNTWDIGDKKIIFGHPSGEWVLAFESTYNYGCTIITGDSADAAGNILNPRSGRDTPNFASVNRHQYGMYLQYPTTWTLIGNQDTFIFNAFSGATAKWSDTLSTSWNSMGQLYAGKFKDYRAGSLSPAQYIALGGVNQSSATYTNSTSFFRQAGNSGDNYYGATFSRGWDGTHNHGEIEPYGLYIPAYLSPAGSPPPMARILPFTIGMADLTAQANTGGSSNLAKAWPVGELYGYKYVEGIHQAEIYDFLAQQAALPPDIGLAERGMTLEGTEIFRGAFAYNAGIITTDPAAWS